MLDTDDQQISSAVQSILDARPTYRVGDRVRVRLSGECVRAWGGYTVFGEKKLRVKTHGHYEALHGRCGVIDLVNGDDHPYRVVFDRPLRLDARYQLVRGLFAATELELLP